MSDIPADIMRMAKKAAGDMWQIEPDLVDEEAIAVSLMCTVAMAERERCANIADQFSLDAEKQAALQQDPMVHDGMLMAADFCELLSDAIRNQTTKGIESGANAAADSSALAKSNHEEAAQGAGND